MVYYTQPALNRTFGALADPTRRAMVAQLARKGVQTAGELAKPHAVSLPAALKHIGVLVDAGLIRRQKIGRTVHCRLEAARLSEAMAWLEKYERFWSARLDALVEFVEGDEQ
jgi:DNA-binding transcriptional ArsR family regulator